MGSDNDTNRQDTNNSAVYSRGGAVGGADLWGVHSMTRQEELIKELGEATEAQAVAIQDVIDALKELKAELERQQKEYER